MKKSLVSVLLVVAMLLALVAVPSAANSDPAADYVHTDAEYKDKDISLWFDYSSEKKEQSNVEKTDMETFVVYMAKNEIENAQFFLSSQSDKAGLTASVTDFSDGNGNTVPAELFIEYYHSAGDHGQIPDAIPPLSAYGAFDLEAGKSQGFIIKLTTTEETVRGDYSATLSVYDSEGKQIKTTTVFAHVWNFALSEETACATSVGISLTEIERFNDPATSGVTNLEMYKSYYDYLLENRICGSVLPEYIYRRAALDYIDNPRVTSFRLANIGGYDGTPLAENSIYLSQAFKNVFTGAKAAERLDKAFHFSGIVDSVKPEELEALYAAYQEFDSVYSAYTDLPIGFITTYINDIDYTLDDGTVIDQIDYYDDFINHWCSKTFAYTSEEELDTVQGAKVLQPLKWNSVYGTFKERMEGYQERGDKVWWFISWDVEEPYINYFMQTDGVAQRLLFWQQYDNDVTGFLYNFANYWMSSNGDPYANIITKNEYPNAYGESILVYPGNKFGITDAVGSLRLEAMRDGIEDYQLFYMLDELKGDGVSDTIIDKMTSGVATYSTDDSAYYNARIELGEAVEAAVNGEEEITVVRGDINGDNEVTTLDYFQLKLILAQKLNPTEDQKLAANVDGSVNPEPDMLDSFAFKFRLAKGYWGDEE